ncbi:flagellin, partial [Luminiphilus sp.]|nr:flagellin [Luminiphilus sp.]
MAVVNTNVNASLAQHALARNERFMNTAMERLSSGRRINNASDDAAGLAIASRMTSQIRGLDVAVRNANDGISMIRTAEGALNEVTAMLIRMRELALQSSNGTASEKDREFLDKEFQALIVEINRVANNTQWNGRNVLDGSATGTAGNSFVSFQVSANVSGSVNTTTGQSFAHDTILGLTAAEVATAGYTGTGTPSGVASTTTGETFAHNDIIGSTETEIDAIPLTGVGSPSRASTTTSGDPVVHNDIIGQSQNQVSDGLIYI